MASINVPLISKEAYLTLIRMEDEATKVGVSYSPCQVVRCRKNRSGAFVWAINGNRSTKKDCNRFLSARDFSA